MLQLQLSAGATEDVDISSVTFSTSGSANESEDITSAALYLDVNNNGGYDLGLDSQIGSTISSFLDNDGDLVFGSLIETIAAGSSENWIVVYNLNDNALDPETFRVYLNSNSDVDADGTTSGSPITPSGAPVQGNIMTVSDVGVLAMSLGANDPGSENINGGAQNVSMLQLHLSASSVEDIQINSIRITPTRSGTLGRGEIVNPDIRIYRDVNNNGVYDGTLDELIVSSNWNSSFSATTVSMSEVIYAGSSEDWLIVHSFSGADVDEYLELAVVQNSDISATGLTSSSSASVTGASVSGGRKTVVGGTTPGTLALSVGGDDPGYRNIASAATDEVMFQLLLSAGSNESVDISSITFFTSGDGEEDLDLTSVLLYQDVDNDGQLNTLNDRLIGSISTGISDDGDLVFTPSPSERIDAGSSENWLVVYNFDSDAADGDDYKVGLAGNGAVVATGVTSGQPVTVTGAPLESGVATVSDVGTLSLSRGSNNPPAHSISADETNLVMLQLQLSAGATEDVRITEINFSMSGTADEGTDLDSVKLLLDINNNGVFDPAYDRQIGATLTTFSNDGTLSFSGISETVTASTSENWIVVYYLSGDASDTETFRAFINDVSQLTAEGISSAGSIVPSGLPVNGNIMTVSTTGALTIGLGSNDPGTENINGSAQNVTMMQLRLSTSAVEDIQINSLRITPTRHALLGRGEIVNPDIRIYRDVNNNGIYDATVDVLIVSRNWNSSFSATTVTLSAVLSAGSTENWLIVHSFSGADEDEYLELAVVQNTDISATGLSSSTSASVTGASVSGGRKTVVSGTTPGTLTLAAGSDNPDYRFISIGTQNEVMIQLQLNASPVEDIQISSIQFATSGSGDESTDIISARLYLDADNDGQLNDLVDSQIGTTITTISDNGTITFGSLSETISSGTAQNWIVVYNYDLLENTINETFQVTLPGNDAVAATGATSSQTITPTGAPVSGGEAVISETGTLGLSAGSANPGNTNITNSETDLEVIQVALNAGPNEDVLVSSVTFSISGTFADNTDFTSGSIELYLDDNGNGLLDAGDSQLGTGQSWSEDNGTVTFSSLSRTIILNTTQYWLLVCDLSGTASAGNNFRVSLNSNNDLSAQGVSTGNPVIPSGAPVMGGLFSISSIGSLTLSVGSNNPGASNESAGAQNLVMLQLALSASSVENIDISSITFTADGSGHDRDDLNDPSNGVSLYNDVNNDGILDGGDTQIDGQQTYSGDNGTVTFTTTGQTIDAGTNENWLVVYDMDGSATDGETFRTGIYNASNISATGVTSTQSITANGPPVVGNFKTISSTGSLTLALGTNNPASAYPDNTAPGNIEMLQFSLTTSSVEGVDITQVVITHQGSGNPQTQLSNVRLIRDVDNDGNYAPPDQIIQEGISFSGTTATFNLTGVSIAANNTENWLVVYTFIGGIATGTSFIATIQSATDITADGSTSSASIIPGGTFSISGGTQTLTAYSNLTVSGSELSPAPSPRPGDDDVGILQLTLSVAQNVSTINSIRIDNRAVSGTSAASDLDAIKIYQETAGAGFNPAQDVLLGSSSVVPDGSGGYAVVTLSSPLDVTISGEILYVAYDIADGAVQTNSVGVLINSSSYLSVKTPETILNDGNFPIQNAQDYSLPVELAAFNASGEPGAIVIEWATASEVNNAGFILQRRIADPDSQYMTVSSYKNNPDLEGAGSVSYQTDYLFKDQTVEMDTTYEYRLLQVDLNGSSHYSSSTVKASALEKLPTKFALKQNYPNPFNPVTTIRFDLPKDSKVELVIYNILGSKVKELVKNEKYKAGKWEITWDGKNNLGHKVATGIYIYRFKAGKYVKSLKMALIK